MRFAALLLLAGVAHADPALDHLDRGIAAYRLGDYDAAHHEFGLAQELAPDKANPYRWLALTEVKQGDCRDAVAHIEQFLSRVPVGDPRVPELVAERQQCVDAAKPQPLPPAPVETPIYRTWWFWTAAGAVVVTAVVVAIVATRGSDEAVLPPIKCSAGGCP